MPPVKLLCQDRSLWEVGQGGPEHQPGKHYPGDYAGRVISAIPASCEYSPADTADPRRFVIPLNPSEEDLGAIRSRRVKLGAFGLEAVTFDDRFGAVADKLREKHEDPEAFEADEVEAVEAAKAANTAERERYDLERLAFEIARKDYVRDIIAFHMIEGISEEAPVAPVAPKPPLVLERQNAFEMEATALAKSLPKTVTHSGAGLYKVEAAGTMPTPDHLWAMEAVNPPDDGDPGGNAGTGSNVTVVGGEIGSALDFNGDNSNVNVGDVAELNSVQTFSIAFRLNQDVLDQTDIIFQKRFNDLYRIRIRTASTGRFEININDGSTHQGWFDYSTVISATSWHHVTVVFDGTLTGDINRLKVYVDGLPIVLTFSEGIPATTPDLSASDALLGYTSTALDGKLDDFRIVADALTDAQVKVLAGRGLAHWDTIAAFDENLLLESERFGESGVWLQTGTPIITANTDVAPNGQMTADTLADDDGAAFEYILQDAAIPNDVNWIYGFAHVKKDSDVSRFPEIQLYLDDGIPQYAYAQLNTSTGATIVRDSLGTYSINVTDLGTYWRVEFGVKNNASGNTTARHRIHPAITTTWGAAESAATGSIVVWGAQLTLLTLQTYRPTRAATDTSVTLTTGGLTDGDRDGEVFVSGGNSYPVLRNGVDSVLVVGDATGEAGACSISPYSGFQSALDQLWADQGSATFTETQYVRVFAGTYVENVVVPAGLVTAWGQYALIVEGDPTDDRDNIVLAPSSGIAWQCAVDTTVLRHMKVVSASAGTYCVYFRAGGQRPTAADLHIISDDLNPIYLYYDGVVEDCVIDQNTNSAGAEGIYCNLAAEIRRCKVTNSAPTTRGIGIFMISAFGGVEGCTIAGYDKGIYTNDARTSVEQHVINTTIYNCDIGIELTGAAGAHALYMLNCIISTVGTCLYLSSYPVEGGGLFGPPVVLRNNCFHSYTTFADDGAATKTHAEFIALSRCDASGDLLTDPLMTDPGAGDFSLQDASPCKWAGHGSGVITGINAVAFDAHHPDIGAWSSGALTVGAPTISSIADDGTTNSVTLSLGADNAQDVLSVYYAKTSDATWTLFGSTRTGPGSLQITGLDVGWWDFSCVAARGGEVSPPSRSVRFAVMATALASPGAALNALLRADSTLAALVGDHIYPQAAPERAKVPYVVSTRVGGTPAHTIAAAAGFVEARFQIDSYGATLEDAQAIADAIRNILDGYRGTVTAGSTQLVVGSIRRDVDIDGFTEPAFAGGVGRHRVIQDYLMTHEESIPVF